MPAAVLLDPIMLLETLGLALLHSLWQGLIIGAAYWALRRIPDRADARYWMGVIALVVLAACVPTTWAWLLSGAGSNPAGPAGSAIAATVLADPAGHDAGESFLSGRGASPMLWVATIWFVGVIVVASRTLRQWSALGALRRGADFSGAETFRATLERLQAALGLHARVRVALSRRVSAPVVVGWIAPVVLLPTSIALGLPRVQLEMILAHELAHLRRGDHWVNLLQIAIETLLFYHPVAGWISHRIRIERELACDELAVNVTGRRLDYVEMLAALERSRPGQPGNPVLALGVDDGQILTRVRRLVAGPEPGRHRGAVSALAALALVAAGAVALPMVASKIDADSDPATAPIRTAGVSSAPPPIADAVEASRDRRVPERPARVPKAPADTGPAAPPAFDPATAIAARGPAHQGWPEPADPRSLLADAAASLASTSVGLSIRTPELSPPVRDPGPAGGEILRRPTPAYPETALRDGISGNVVLEITVDRQGRVGEAVVVDEPSGSAALARAALRAVRQWRFAPFTVDGRAVTHRTTVVFEFEPRAACRPFTGSRIRSC